MSELPPPPPSDLPPEPKHDPEIEPPLSRGACAALGCALFVGCGIMTIAVHQAIFIGLALAIVSLFFSGYRYIFVGYILTGLSLAGIAFLALIIICGNGNHM